MLENTCLFEILYFIIKTVDNTHAETDHLKDMIADMDNRRVELKGIYEYHNHLQLEIVELIKE